MLPSRPRKGEKGAYERSMKPPTNALLALSAIACAAVVAGGQIVLVRLVAPEAALIRVVDGAFPDCDGAGFEVLAGRDLDRSGALSDREAEISAVACKVDGRLEVSYEPEAVGPAFEEQGRARRRHHVLLDFSYPPTERGCGDAALGVSAGVDRDRDEVLAEAEITDERIVCGTPAMVRYARAR
jgi:hypothetical protein